MNTKSFNLFDKIIARLRLCQVVGFVDNNDIILDFGCGERSFLLEGFKNKILIGVGLDYKILNKKSGNVSYLKYKFDGKLPFENKLFDKIFMLAVLEHIDEDQVKTLFLEFKRILKNNGKIILTTPTPRSRGWLEFLAFKLRVISKQEISDHKKYYSSSDIIRLADETGFNLADYKFFQLGLNSYAVLEKIS